MRQRPKATWLPWKPATLVPWLKPVDQASLKSGRKGELGTSRSARSTTHWVMATAVTKPTVAPAATTAAKNRRKLACTLGWPAAVKKNWTVLKPKARMMSQKEKP